MAKQRMYMEMPAQGHGESGHVLVFQERQCGERMSDWLKIAKNKGGTCHKVGSETVNGRNTVKYEETLRAKRIRCGWIRKCASPSSGKTKDSGGELRNIREGRQPESLFQIPADYTKMDMGGMKRPQH